MFLRLEGLLLIFETVPAIGGQWGNVVWWGMYVKIGAQRLLKCHQYISVIIVIVLYCQIYYSLILFDLLIFYFIVYFFIMFYSF